MLTYLKKNSAPILILGLAYFTAGRLGTLLAIPPGYASAVFPASGVALAFLLWRGPGPWPGILLGSFFMNLSISTAGNPGFSLAHFFPVGLSIGLGASGEALLGAWLLRRVAGSNNPLSGTVNVFAFIVLSAMLGSTVSATTGVIALSTGGLSDWKTFWESWYTWWYGDAMGIMIFAPLPFVRFRPERINPLRIIEMIFLLFLAVAGIKTVFGSGALAYPLAFLPFPFLVWVVFRFGQPGAVTGLCLISILTVLETVSGRGPFADNRSQSESLFLLQTFLGMAALMTLILSAALDERKKTSALSDEILDNEAHPEKNGDNPLIIPILMGLGALILTFFIFRAAQINEAATLSNKVSARAENLRNRTMEKLATLTRALDRMGARFELHGHTPQPDWEADARNYISHYREIQAVEWVDPTLHVRWIVPLQGNEQAMDMALALEESRHTAMVNAMFRREMVITRTIDLIQGGKGVLIFRPIYYGDEFGGLLVLAVRVRTLLSALMEEESTLDFRLSVLDGGAEVYEEEKPVDRIGEKWRQGVNLDYEGLSWTVWLEPKTGFLKKNESAIPQAIFFLGSFMFLILASAAFYAQDFSRKSRELQASNQLLEKEIAVRVEAEESLMKIRDHLEDLVRQRTREIELSRQELAKSEAHYHSLTENSPVGIFRCDPEGNCTYVNERWEEITGMSQKEALGRGWEKVFQPDDKERFFSEWNRAWREGIPLASEYRFLLPDGRTTWVSCRGNPEKDAQGRLIGYVRIVMDITQRKAAEEKLILSQARLIHAEKLSALGKLTGTIAHEFNNPIYGLRSIIEQTREEEGLDEEIKALLDLALRECDRMAGLIRKLQGFYKPSDETRTDVDVHHLLDDIEALIKKKLTAKKIKLVKNYNPNPPKIQAVEDQVRQVLLNLINNAEEAIHGGNGEIVITTESNDSHIKVRIQDTGEGIHEKNLKFIFDPFFSTKGIKGTGLGLSVCHGIVDAHGGDLDVISKQGEGSTFILTLPVSRENHEGDL